MEACPSEIVASQRQPSLAKGFDHANLFTSKSLALDRGVIDEVAHSGLPTFDFASAHPSVASVTQRIRISAAVESNYEFKSKYCYKSLASHSAIAFRFSGAWGLCISYGD